MSRELPLLIQNAKDQNAQRTFWLLNIGLKASGDYPAENLYISSQAVQYSGHFYEPRLRTKPQTKFTLGTATDGGTTKIDNTDLEIGQKILPKERFVEGSTVEMFFAWKLADGSIYADKVFDGEVGRASLSMGSNDVTLTLVGDVYNPRVILGAFPLTQRCVHVFNKNGLLSPNVSPCGWQVEQGGNPLKCLKTEEDCIAHNNLHRIGAIPFFANVVVQIINGNGTDSSGFPTTGCFINESPILLPDFSEMSLGEFREGMPVMSFNERTGLLEPDFVEQVHIHPAEPRKLALIQFSDRIIEGVTPEHPVFRGGGLFSAVGDLKELSDVPEIIGSNLENYTWNSSLIRAIEWRIENKEVRNLSVRKNKTFIVARRGVHNLKVEPVYPVNI